MIVCAACRAELPDEAQFCGDCGFRVAQPPSDVEPAEAAPPILLQRVKRRSGAPAAGPERRDLQRHALVAEVSLSSKHHFYRGLSENLSEVGLFVATSEPPPVGTEVEVTFNLPVLSRSIRTRAEVRWIRRADPATGRAAGVGLELVGLTPADRRAIEIFARHRAPALPDEEER